MIEGRWEIVKICRYFIEYMLFTIIVKGFIVI